MKALNAILFASILAFTLACKEDAQLPIVDFSFDDNQKGPAFITFQNLSTFAEHYSWDFGDGNISRSENPTNYYTLPGTFTVRLTATNGGGSQTIEKKIRITGTSYAVKNGGSNTLKDVFSFYHRGDSTFLSGWGDIHSQEHSGSIYTTRSDINIGYRKDDGRIFAISQTFLLAENQ